MISDFLTLILYQAFNSWQ